MNKINSSVYDQKDKYSSPWSMKKRISILIWEYVWFFLCVWTPKPFNPFRILILRLFGCKVFGKPFVHQRARIYHPWNLTLKDRACLGDRSTAYCLGEIILSEGCTIAQEAYLCTGSHLFTDPSQPLITAPIFISENAFIGLRAIVLPGITIGSSSIVGAGSVVTKNVPDQCTFAGNPARNCKK